MANHKSSKKRIIRNANRALINGARMSRIRTFVKKVETAIAEGDAAVAQMLDAHHPMLAVSILGLPGLSVPVSCNDNTPIGVQIVGPRFGEDLCFEAGAIIEAHYSVRMPVDPMG